MRPDLSRQQKREKSWLKHNIRKLNKVDTTYIEPQRYNYAFMIQNTNTYELYRIKSNLGYSVTFAPNMSLRVGPYFVYSLLSLLVGVSLKRLLWRKQKTG